jgi:hypothetical protein
MPWLMYLSVVSPWIDRGRPGARDTITLQSVTNAHHDRSCRGGKVIEVNILTWIGSAWGLFYKVLSLVKCGGHVIILESHDVRSIGHFHRWISDWPWVVEICLWHVGLTWGSVMTRMCKETLHRRSFLVASLKPTTGDGIKEEVQWIATFPRVSLLSFQSAFHSSYIFSVRCESWLRNGCVEKERSTAIVHDEGYWGL